MKRKFDWIFRGVFLLLIAFFAGFSCSEAYAKDNGDAYEYKKWTWDELWEELNFGSVRNNIEKHLNGASISSVVVLDQKKFSKNGVDCVVFTLEVSWKGRYNTSGTAEVDYVCKIVDDQLQYRSLEIVSSKNPTVEEYCKVVAATHDAEVISDPKCDIRQRIENGQRVSVYEAYTSKFYVETVGNTKDTGINGSNITRIAIVYHMKWNGTFFKGRYTDLAYVYTVKNGNWKHEDSGIIDTNDPEPGITEIAIKFGMLILMNELTE